MIKLFLKNKNGKTILKKSGNNIVNLSHNRNFVIGDYFQIQVDKVPCYIWVQLDESIKPALIYLTKNVWNYKLPLEFQRETPYAEGTFMRRNGYSWARYATDKEVVAQYNLSQNSYDQHENSSAYPHASANVETRNESVFYAKNSIDGILANNSHGNYPFQSWGIGDSQNPKLRIEFGRPIEVDAVGIVLRADYPHDSYWKKATLSFDDNQDISINLQKTGEEQYFKIDHYKTSSIELSDLIKDDLVPGFVSLTQIEVFGKNL